MKTKLLYIGLSVVAAFTLSSCKNDLDVLAPGEESVSVYGIINPNQTVQNIRINKVYLTDGDALAAGQNSETINYGPGELQVTLQRFMTGSTTQTLTTVGNPTKKEIVLTETVVTTANGNFNTEQRIWQTTDKLYNSGEYKLTIKNLASGKEFTSQTLMVDSVKTNNIMPIIYLPFAPPNHFPAHCGTGNGAYSISGIITHTLAYVNYVALPNAINTRRILFKSVLNAKSYKVVMRFHYIDSLTDNVTGFRRFVDMNFPTQTATSLLGGEEMEVSFDIPDFYSNLANQIPKQTVGTIKNRTAHYMEYIIYASNDELHTFLQVNEPSNTIAQDKPNYTNINGGVGVFAATSRASYGKELLSDFINEISNNSATSSLQFVKRYAFICP